MAYREVYRSPSQSNTTISPIDGIGIKINDRLVPPRRVSIPPEYEPGNPSEILFMEYDFSVEEHVLKWCEAHRQNEQAIQQAATRRVGDTIETFSQVAEPSPPLATASPAGAETAWDSAEQALQPAPTPSPFINLGSTILTPMPITQGHKRQESGSKNAQTGLIDLTDFENEQDPFENMALRVLNDREELNKMVFEVQPLPDSVANVVPASGHSSVDQTEVAVSSDSQIPTRPSPPCTPVNLRDVDYPEVESLDSREFPLPQQAHTGSQLSLQTNAHHAFYQPPHTATGLPPPQPTATSTAYSSQNINHENSFHYSQGIPLPPISTSHYAVQQVTTSSGGPTYMNAESVSVPSTAGSVIGQTESVSLTTAGVTYTNQLGVKDYVPYQNYYSRHSQENTPNGQVFSSQDSGQPVVLLGTQGQGSPPLNPLRSVRSTPDISGSEDRRLPPLMPSSHTPPPTARSSSPNDIAISGIPLPKSLTHQNWNHYSILPSTPRSLDNTPIPSPDALVNNAKAELPNPFGSLSQEAQRYVENITDMGFPRARVARAVQKLGTDDKKVVDHLCMVTRLSDQGYTEDYAEMALLLFENNIEQAEQYLKLLFQFKEIGFAEENIQEALVSTNLDENKTLDCLTAS